MNLLRKCWVSMLPCLLCAVVPCALPAAEKSGYRLNSGDAVEIRFFYNPELNENVMVRPDGTISMPLIGEVTLVGKSPAEAAAEIEGRYASILKKPAITIQVAQFNSQRVYVGGEVNRPGMLPLTTPQTVLAALLESGGIKHTGGDWVTLIRRNANGTASVQQVSIRGRKGAPAPASLLMLQPFDVVLLPESKIARVDRWVDEYIKQVLPGSLSGGFSYLVNGYPY